MKGTDVSDINTHAPSRDVDIPNKPADKAYFVTPICPAWRRRSKFMTTAREFRRLSMQRRRQKSRKLLIQLQSSQFSKLKSYTCNAKK